MIDVTVKKHDAVYDRVVCDDSIGKEINEYFRFRPKGFHFTPQYKNRVSDGWIYLFSSSTGLLYTGLREELRKFIAGRKYSMSFEFDIADREFSLLEGQEFIRSLNIPLMAHDFQEHGFVKGVRKSQQLFIAPTGSGKSLIMYLFARFFKKKTLIITTRTDLVNQLYSDFVSYGCPEYLLHKVYQGQEKETVAPIVISTFQSLFNLPKSWFETYEVVIGDECHHYESKSFVKIMTNLSKAHFRFGVTGTVDETKVHQNQLVGLFGPITKLAHTHELIERKILSDFEIKALCLKHEFPTFADYDDEIKYLFALEARNKFITNLTLSLKGNILVLYRLIELHGDLLYDLLKTTSEREIYYLHGGIKGEERDKIRKIINKSGNVITLASYGIFSEGVNVPQIDNIIFASPYRSSIKVSQSIGRGLRRSQTKEKCTLYDIADDNMSLDKNFTLKHYEARLKLYEKERFLTKIYNIRM